ncbi:exodeoxyribonuclease VII large subunit [Clostridium sp. D2Q-11]|uniref:Exodeoxyribonuclease 7 large subunit n=1 Tax=Anaeromonas frigoriresistens TaxID=2683708 RepID=A0A942UVG3_9FIRM|nr:exodeoxyribonuclease VII large subunit [Anaeromonas frigoriresistens]MBS4539984.1 exodeoxyribonuclease VII large subunit [Anaeromonas frigoriresistens]
MELKPLRVSELNSYIKKVLGSDPILNSIKIEGEISNFKHHYSGHMYFTLKDEKSRIKCVMFNGDNRSIDFSLEDGMKIVAEGYVSVYERDGCYQLYVKNIKKDGVGDLYIKYEKLKKQLEQEGLFNEINKKSINKYPKRIGVVTSSTGAAVRDIINVITRRNPTVDILIYSVHVQGIYAKNEICKGINHFNNREDIDTIIIGRGGGSIEELWSFNEEEVAREIYNSKIPIISAVGHETDFTIVDFVSDLRAPTPSAAGELAVEDIEFMKERLTNVNGLLIDSMNRLIQNQKEILYSYRRSRLFTEPIYYINQYKQRLDFQFKELITAKNTLLNNKKNKLENVRDKLTGLNPLSILERGFTYVEDNSKTIVKSVLNINEGNELLIHFKDGNVKAIVSEIQKKEEDYNG